MDVTTNKKSWEFRNSIWIFWTFTGMLNFISFFYVGNKVKDKNWLSMGWVYLAVMWGISIIRDVTYLGYSFDRLLGKVVGLTYILAIVHAFAIRKEYLRRLSVQEMAGGNSRSDDWMRRQRNWAAERYRQTKGSPNPEYRQSQGTASSDNGTQRTSARGQGQNPPGGAAQSNRQYGYGMEGSMNRMKEVKVKSALPFYFVGALWVILAALAPMYRLIDYVIGLVLSVVVFVVAEKLIPKKTILVEEPYIPPKTGNEELDKMMEEGHDFIVRMNKANEAIPDPVISDQIDRLEELSGKIFAYVKDHPDSIGQIRRFMNYYLPTTLKLLESYQLFETQNIKGENITATMEKIERILDTIVKAFETQLDHLFSSQAMDISADITVLEGMLAQEGLSDDGIHTGK